MNLNGKNIKIMLLDRQGCTFESYTTLCDKHCFIGNNWLEFTPIDKTKRIIYSGSYLIEEL